MAVIAMNWELGADLGHIGRFLPIALELRRRGHRPVMLLRDISRAESILGPHGLEFMQAPVWLTHVSGLPPDINFTETMFRFGYLHPPGLLSMCRAWRAVWALLNPAVLIFDHAPTAMLAARGMGLPRVVIGNSFAIPPSRRPLPRFRWWTDGVADGARLLETEARATRNGNFVLKALGAPLLGQVSDIFAAEKIFICSSPDLDVYGVRSDGQYLGPINNVEHGEEPTWPKGRDAKVFAYIKPGYKHFEVLLEAISRCKLASYLIFAPGMPEQWRKKYGAPHIVFSESPFKMAEVVRDCSTVICHAGGVTDVALQAGRPVLLLPTQMEQTMTSRRVESLGAGVFLPLDGNPANIAKLLKQLHTDSSLSLRAEEYAATSCEIDRAGAIDNLVTACVSLTGSA